MTAVTLSPASSGALAVNPWALLPPLGNLDAYIAAVNRMPMLTLEQEQAFSQKLKEQNDLEAASKLILSHLRLVVSISRQYAGYGLPHADLIQEGNVGLMKAVKRFDPAHGVRLVSYAIHWIKAEIHEYILRNWRMVKVATTKAQRKLFFNLRSMKHSMKAEADDDVVHRNALTAAQIEQVASTLKVKPEEVLEMETRMSGGDVLLDPAPSDDGEQAFGPIAYLSDAGHEPTAAAIGTRRQTGGRTIACGRRGGSARNEDGERRHENASGQVARLACRPNRVLEARQLSCDVDGFESASRRRQSCGVDLVVRRRRWC